MGYVLPVVAAFLAALALGGRPERLAALQLRGLPLAFGAFALQVLAFPFEFLPWRTETAVAIGLWLTSYGLLLGAAYLNRHVIGVGVLALGAGLNLVAIVSNGGHMPVLPEAMRSAGLEFEQQLNSIADATPAAPAFVDRFVAPDWLPMTNFYSIGDIAIWLGAALVVFAAMTDRGLGSRRAEIRPTEASEDDAAPVALGPTTPAWARLDA